MLKILCRKRLLALLLVFCMGITMLPAAASAEGEQDKAAQAAEAEEMTAEESDDAARNNDAAASTSVGRESEQAEGEMSDTDQGSVTEGDGQEPAEKEPEAAGVLPDEGSKQNKKMTKLQASKAGPGTYDIGDTVKYKSSNVSAGGDKKVRSFSITSEGGAEFSGTCAEIGVSAAKSGSATISSLNERTKKLLYKYAVQDGWWNGKKASKKATALVPGTVVRYKQLVANITQIGEQGKGWIDAAVEGADWPRSAAKTWYKVITGLDVSDVILPDDFEAYKCTCPKGTQSFVIWSYTPSEYGYAELKKTPSGTTGASDSRYDLSGAKYQLFKDSGCSIPVEDEDGETVIFITDENGDSTETAELEPGDYWVKEIKAPKGFAINGTPVYLSITTDHTTEVPYVIQVSDQPVKTKFRKTDAAGVKPMSGARLQLKDQSGKVLDTWTANGTDHVIEALGQGEYTLSEISAPYGYDMADDIRFTLAEGEDKTVEMKNTPVTVGTSAVSASTNISAGMRKKNETIRDSVHMTGLVKGRKYRLTGQLMNKRTGSAIAGAAASREFTASAAAMDITVDITFDSTALADGDSVVVYETLYRTSAVHGETVPVELQKHQDINDKAQTISFPFIRTKAAISDDNRVITDTISYGNLIPGRKYIFRGWLVDTASGTKISGSDGKADLTVEEDISGSVAVKMDASGYDSVKGHSMTAFEELYVIETVDGKEKEIKVAEHKDRSGDASGNPQIAEIHQDLKVSKNVTGNLGDLSKVFEYKAEFTGLVPGQPYKIEGDDVKTFMADASGKASAGIRLKDGQTAVIRDLPKGAAYKLTEAASDHIAEYRMFSEDMADKGAKIIKAAGSNRADAGKALATELENVDQFDGTVVILWENNRDLATITGVAGPDYAAYSAALALLATGAFVIIRKRKKYAEEDDAAA